MSGGNTPKAYYNKYNRESPFKTTKQREDEKAQKQAEKVSQKNLFQKLWEVLNRGNLEEIDRFQQANVINGLTPLQQLQKIDFKDYQKASFLALKCFPSLEHRTPSEKPTSKIPSIAELEAQIQEKERQKRLGKNYRFNALAVCPL